MLGLTHTNWLIFRGIAIEVSYDELDIFAVQALSEGEVDATAIALADNPVAEALKQKDFMRKLQFMCVDCIHKMRAAALKPATGDTDDLRARLPDEDSLEDFKLTYRVGDSKIVGEFNMMSTKERVKALRSYPQLLTQIVGLVRHDDEAVILGK